MARFDFKSPGAAFTGQIADVLAERKATERQQLLDQLTMNADVRAQEEATRRGEESKAQLAGMQQQQELARLGVLRSGLKRGGMPTSPENEALLSKWDLLEDLPTPQVSTSTEFAGPEGAQVEGGPAPIETAPPPPKRRGYVGSLDEQREAESMQNTASLIQQLMSKPETRAAGEQLAALVSGNRNMATSDMIARTVPQNVPHKIFHQETGTYTDAGMMPENTRINVQSRPPQERRPRNLLSAIGPNGEAVMIDQESIPIVNGVAQLPPGVTLRGASGAANSQATTLGISDGAYRTYQENLELIELGENGKATPTSMLPVRRVAKQMIGNSKASPWVKEMARRFVDNPDSIRTEAAPSEKDALQLKQLLGVLAADATDVELFRGSAAQQPKTKPQTAPAAIAPNSSGTQSKTPVTDMERFMLNRDRY